MESDKFQQHSQARLLKMLIFLNPMKTIRAKGKLIIHGVEQERIIKSKNFCSGKWHNYFICFSVPLKDHKIKVPRVVQDKIANEVLVQVKATLRRK